MAHEAPPAIEPAPSSESVARMELLLSVILRAGVIVSFLVITIGTVVSFVQHPDYAGDNESLHRLVSPSAAYPTTLKEVVIDAFRGRGPGLIMLGVLLLLATPVVRVAASAVMFAAQRERSFVVITLAVLVLLVGALWLGN
jgi:uncharacterized membrane protein